MNYIGSTIELLLTASAIGSIAAIDIILAKYLISGGDLSRGILQKSTGLIALFFIILAIKSAI
jgi:hypothetical protein